MKPHEERVIAEKAELEAKIARLSTFIRSPAYRELPIEEKQLLLRQEVLMCELVQCLVERIALFKAVA